MHRALLALAIFAAPSYAQVAACAPCHAKTAADFRKTGMGRSFSRISPADFPTEPYYHQASDSYFSMTVRDGRVFQRRWQIAPDGKPTNVDEKQADFVLGSGNHARTYLHLTARGTLQQLPLGWYAEKSGTFAMNPGYDKPDYPGSTRPIQYECMGCHNAYPRIPAANQEESAEPLYLTPLPEGIDCQRCHGSGREHIATSGKAAIVNPAKLPPDREFEVCLQCHLETSSALPTHAIQKHGRKPFSYLPGQPLADFLLTFDRAPGTNQAVEVAGAPYRLRQSRCYLQSAGKLRCTTCHNPHDIPRGDAALAAYNKVCADCHAASHRAAENCVGCHMPRTRTDDAVHIVITDHRIQRGPVAGDRTAEKSETHDSPATDALVPYYPAHVDSLYETIAQLRNRTNLPANLKRLASLIAEQHPAQPGFYADLGEAARTAGDFAQATRAFDDALTRAPDSPVILLKLGNALIEARQWARAEAILRKVTVRPQADPVAWGELGWSLWQQDKATEARAALLKAIALDPELPEAHNYLGQLLLGTGDAPGAEREFREGVRLTPGIAEWRANLGGVLARLGKLPEARYQFEQAIRFKPQDAATRVDYSRFLASQGQESDAEKQVRTAIDLDPALAAAHEMFGALLSNRNDPEGALRELRQAVELAPGFARAQYELGVVLYSKGDVPAGIEHLKLASQGGSREAAQFLKQVGK